MSNGKFLEQVYAASVAGVIVDDKLVVTTAGTRVQFAANQPCRQIVITALSGNTNAVVVGGVTVVAALATRKGIPLSASQAITIGIDNLSKLYLDSITNGEGVSYSYLL